MLSGRLEKPLPPVPAQLLDSLVLTSPYLNKFLKGSPPTQSTGERKRVPTTTELQSSIRNALQGQAGQLASRHVSNNNNNNNNDERRRRKKKPPPSSHTTDHRRLGLGHGYSKGKRRSYRTDWPRILKGQAQELQNGLDTDTQKASAGVTERTGHGYSKGKRRSYRTDWTRILKGQAQELQNRLDTDTQRASAGVTERTGLTPNFQLSQNCKALAQQEDSAGKGAYSRIDLSVVPGAHRVEETRNHISECLFRF
ncbi:hypothetical protein STEG23_038343 [Scotinomys teguina]